MRKRLLWGLAAGLATTAACGRSGIVDPAATGPPEVRIVTELAFPCATAFDCGECGFCEGGQCAIDTACRDAECRSDYDCGPCEGCDRYRCMPRLFCSLEECLSDRDCPPGERCVNNPRGEGVCEAIAVPAPGAGFWEACATHEDCAGGLCVPLGELGAWVCSRACSPAALCPPGYACVPAGEVSVCQPEALPELPCERAPDCPAGMVCGHYWDATTASVRSKCFAAGPGAAPSEPCEPETTECTTGLCPGHGECSQPCVEDLDCPPLMLCDDLRTSVPEETVVYRGCIDSYFVLGEAGDICPRGDTDCKSGICVQHPGRGPKPFCADACEAGLCAEDLVCAFAGDREACIPLVIGGPCQREGDCAAGETCAVRIAGPGEEPETECRALAPGGEPLGGTCDSASGTPFCASSICLEGEVCSAVCADEADCPAPLRCDYYPVNLGDGRTFRTKLCQKDFGSRLPCVRDAECANGEVCGLFLHPRSGDPRSQCRAPLGTGTYEEPCAGPEACHNGVCTDQGRCTHLCDTGADCPEDAFCGLIAANLGAGLTVIARGCVPDAPPAEAAIGAPCPSGAGDCPGLSCFNNGIDPPVCTRPCAADADCGPARCETAGAFAGLCVASRE